MSLLRKTTSGLFWNSLSMVFMKIINFIVTIILARLLEPEHFGLIALALVFVNFFEQFRHLGIGPALIHKKDDIDKAANTAFFLFPAAAAVFYLASYLIAPFAADFFNEPQIEEIIKILSLVFVIWSFGTLPSVLLDKNLEFKKKMIPQILPKIGYGITAILLALDGFGVWSLVIGRLILEILSVIAIWPVVDWRPNYKFDKTVAFELINYGREIMNANLLIFIISIIDVTFIGRLLGTEDLGFYSIALGTAGLLTSQVASLISGVMFPVFATINDKNTLKKAFTKTIKYISVIAIPSSFGLLVVAWDFIKVIYGDKWLPAVASLQVLSFYALNRSLLGTTENLYLAVGKPEIRTKLNFLQLVLMSLFLYPLTLSYGIIGTGIAALVPSTLILLLTFREASMILDENFMYIPRLIQPFIVGSILMVSAIYLIRYTLSLSPTSMLIVSVVFGLAVYLGFLWLTQKDEIKEIKRLIKA